MQHQFLQMVEQNAAGALDHALGQTGGAGRIHDVQRMVEGQLFEFDVEIGFRGDEIAEHHRIGHAADIRIHLRVRYHDDFFDGRKLFQDGADPLQRVDLFAFEKIPVGREEHLGPYLSEAVENTLYAEVRRAGRPDGAHARCRQHGNDRLGHVGHESHDPVAGLHTGLFERCRDTSR